MILCYISFRVRYIIAYILSIFNLHTEGILLLYLVQCTTAVEHNTKTSYCLSKTKEKLTLSLAPVQTPSRVLISLESGERKSLSKGLNTHGPCPLG